MKNLACILLLICLSISGIQAQGKSKSSYAILTFEHVHQQVYLRYDDGRSLDMLTLFNMNTYTDKDDQVLFRALHYLDEQGYELVTEHNDGNLEKYIFRRAGN